VDCGKPIEPELKSDRRIWPSHGDLSDLFGPLAYRLAEDTHHSAPGLARRDRACPPELEPGTPIGQLRVA
jgi:hypothetical protein